MSRPDATPPEDATMPPLVYETVAWLRFYTHLPLPTLPGESEATTPADPLRTAQAVPIAGALIGAVAGLVLAIFASLGASPFVAAAAATLTLVASTHARPELALAALAERMFGGPNGVQEHHGTLGGLADRFRHHGHTEVLLAARVTIYGVLAILLAVLVRVGALESLTAKAAVATAFALVGAGAIARAAATSFALIRSGGTGESPRQSDQSALQWLVAIGLGIGIVTVLPGFGVGATIAGIAAAIGAAALVTAFVPRAETEGGRLFTGTAELIAEIAFLIAVVAFSGDSMSKKQPVSSDRLLWIVIAALGLTVIALALRHQQGTIAGLELEQFASLAYFAALLVLITGFGYFFYHSRVGAMIRAALFWAMIALVLALGYSYRYELEAISERLLSELLISRPVTVSSGTGATVQVARARGGDFTVQVELNGQPVTMLVDTGASSVVLTQEAAKAANLPLDLLKYDVPIETASGRTRAAAIVIDQIAVGGIVERRVPALVSAPGDLRTSLLGMSFLNRLRSFEITGGRLILRAK